MCDLGRHLWEVRSPESPWAAGLLCILSVFVFVQTLFKEAIFFFLQFEATSTVVFCLFLIETTIVLKIFILENTFQRTVQVL